MSKAKLTINGSGDCGNSPKNQLTQDIAVGLETGALACDLLADDVIWHTTSGKKINGIDAVTAALGQIPTPKAINVDHAIAHGKIGMANGTTTKAAGAAHRFAHVLTFTTTSAKKIAVITSYTAD